LQQELPKVNYCYAADGKAIMTQRARNVLGQFQKTFLEEEIVAFS
jgi:hypothetical protein